MDKTKIGQGIKFCPIFDATLVHEFMRDSVAESNPRCYYREIYLNNANRTEKSKLKTILRYMVK